MSELDLVKQKGNMSIFPGQKVEVYYHIDKKFKIGVVVRRYGKRSMIYGWLYPDLVDVKLKKGKKEFISKGHFTYGIRRV